MTVIAAACGNGRAWMASDSDSIDGDGRPWPNARKIIPIRGGGEEVALLGHSGPSRVHQRIRQRLDAEGIPGDPGPADDDDWADALARHIDVCAREDPSLDDDGHFDSIWLLARATGLWLVRPGYATPLGTYNAIGSGGDLALGVLYGRLEGVLHATDVAIREALSAGVQAALRFDEGCRGAVVLRELGT